MMLLIDYFEGLVGGSFHTGHVVSADAKGVTFKMEGSDITPTCGWTMAGAWKHRNLSEMVSGLVGREIKHRRDGSGGVIKRVDQYGIEYSSDENVGRLEWGSNVRFKLYELVD